MRKAACIVLLSIFLNLTAPLHSDAIAPLVIYAAAALGATVLTMGATHFALSKQNTSYNFDGNALVRPIIAYNNVLIGGANVALGKACSAILDIKKAYDEKKLQDYLNLNRAIQEYYPITFTPELNDIVDYSNLLQQYQNILPGTQPESNYKCVAYSRNYPTYSYPASNPPWPNGSSWSTWDGETLIISVGNFVQEMPDGRGAWEMLTWSYQPTTGTPTYDPENTSPPILPPENASPLSEHIYNSIPSNPSLENELDELMKNNPSLFSFPDTLSLPENPNSIEDYPPAQPITAGDLTAYSQQVNAEANQTLVDTLTDLVAANPTDTNLAAELAKAQADAAKDTAQELADNAPPPEPEEPSYNLPGSWYSPICDSSEGFSSCINYQSLLTATDSWKDTAIYQVPNLIISCLGYVEGSGCTHPPVISVDFLSSYTGNPTIINLEPFETVVSIVKFFFSIICIVGTCKLIMNLYS